MAAIMVKLCSCSFHSLGSHIFPALELQVKFLLNPRAAIISKSLSRVWMWLPGDTAVQNILLMSQVKSSYPGVFSVSPVRAVKLKQDSLKEELTVTPKCMCLAISWLQRKSTRTILEEVNSSSVLIWGLEAVPVAGVCLPVQQDCQLFRWTGQCLCQWVWSLGSHCLLFLQEWRRGHRWDWAGHLEQIHTFTQGVNIWLSKTSCLHLGCVTRRSRQGRGSWNVPMDQRWSSSSINTPLQLLQSKHFYNQKNTKKILTWKTTNKLSKWTM